MEETVELIACPSPVSSQPPKAANFRSQLPWNPPSQERGQPLCRDDFANLCAQEVSFSLTMYCRGLWSRMGS